MSWKLVSSNIIQTKSALAESLSVSRLVINRGNHVASQEIGEKELSLNSYRREYKRAAKKYGDIPCVSGLPYLGTWATYKLRKNVL